jgi:hypothetical protein
MKLKWDITGKGDEAWGAGMTQYEGPVPPKGSYVAKIKRMTVGAIKSQGDNHGKPRISVLLEVVGGAGSEGLGDPNYTYYGAPIWDGLNIIKTQTPKVNAFLHALTDGSDEAKRAVETAFWPPNGPDARKESRRDGSEDIHIKAIGKYQIGSPAGEHLVRIITKMGADLQGDPRAEVNQYLPYKGDRPKAQTNGQVTKDETSGMEIVEGELVEDDDNGIIDAMEIIANTPDDDVVNLDAVEEPPF